MQHIQDRIILAAFAAFVFLLVGTAGTAGAQSIRIGHAIDLSGPNGSLGRDYVAGIKTYFDMLNSTGGINGRKVSYVVEDDRGEPQRAVQLVSDMLKREPVDFLFGGVGDAVTRAVLDSTAFRRSGQVLYAPLAGADFNARERLLFWRPSYAQEVRHVLAHFGKLGMSSVALVVQDTPVAELAERELQAELQARGLKVVSTAKLGVNGEQADQAAARIAGARSGFVLVIADTIGTAMFLKEFRRHDGQTFVAGTSLVNLQTMRELAGMKAVEWTVFSQVVPNPASGTSLLQLEHLKMMRTYRDEPVSALTLEGFAAAKALVLALQKARPGERSLPALFARSGALDLGGLAVAPDSAGRLSGYVDIALFSRGGGLVF